MKPRQPLEFGGTCAVSGVSRSPYTASPIGLSFQLNIYFSNDNVRIHLSRIKATWLCGNKSKEYA